MSTVIRAECKITDAGDILADATKPQYSVVYATTIGEVIEVPVYGGARSLARASVVTNFDGDRYCFVTEIGQLMKQMYTTREDAEAAALLYYTNMLREFPDA